MFNETERITPLVQRVLEIEAIRTEDSSENLLVTYWGRLRGDSAAAYDSLSESLRPLRLTPLFRNDEGRHVVSIAAGRIEPKPSNPVVNLILLLATILSVIFVGTVFFYDGPPADSTAGMVRNFLGNLNMGLAFAVSLMAILLAHEFGHYLAGRFHHTHVTLPYFIPFPLSYFGTMGAFIQLKEPPKNKRVLLDIGVAGPLSGLVVAIPIVILGLSLSHIEPIAASPGQAFILEGNSVIYLLSKYLVFGKLLPAPESYGSISPFLYWIRYFFTGHPVPAGGLDVIIHPVAWAGWAGLLVTSLNLIPAGQLDGGHLLYVLFGQRARQAFPFILGGLILLGMVWVGWWIWAGIVFLLGRVYAEPLDQITTLDPRRRAVAILGLIVFFLVFTPVPLIQAVAGG